MLYLQTKDRYTWLLSEQPRTGGILANVTPPCSYSMHSLLRYPNYKVILYANTLALNTDYRWISDSVNLNYGSGLRKIAKLNPERLYGYAEDYFQKQIQILPEADKEVLISEVVNGYFSFSFGEDDAPVEDWDIGSYQQKLRAFGWYNKRSKKLILDRFKCQGCGTYGTIHIMHSFQHQCNYAFNKLSYHQQRAVEPAVRLFQTVDIPVTTGMVDFPRLDQIRQEERVPLQIHHKYYVLDTEPWDYPDDALETLCVSCHQQRHEDEIPVYSKVTNQLLRTGETAQVCHRCSGSGFIPQYKHVMDGVCFRCWGDGVVNF